MYFLYNSLTKGEISTSNSKICGGYTSSGNKNPTPFPTVTSKPIKGMGVFFQAIHPNSSLIAAFNNFHAA
jgi:hypothetical protein